MDQRRFVLLEALKKGARHADALRLYERGKLPGLFAGRTRLHAEIAGQAVRDGLLELVRTEVVGKNVVEWVRVTPRGIDHLLQSESPARALDELIEVLKVNRDGIPTWVAGLHARLDELSRSVAAEIEAMRTRLDEIAAQAGTVLDRLAESHAPASVPWAQDVLEILQQRRQVGLGERCALVELFAALRERHVGLTLLEFHQGLKRLHERQLVVLFPDVPNGTAPGPEYALLDGPTVYYYVGRAAGEETLPFTLRLSAP